MVTGTGDHDIGLDFCQLNSVTGGQSAELQPSGRSTFVLGESSLPTPSSSFSDTVSGTHVSPVSRDTSQGSRDGTDSGRFRISITMVCTSEQLKEVMVRLADAGSNVSIRIDPQ